jgi:hypothetical protein
MKVKANKRPRQIRGMLACRCCDNLYDKHYKLDKQIAKEIEEDIKDFNVEDVLAGCS